jgi:hypothetical protein
MSDIAHKSSRSSRGIRAWLVTWEWSSDSAEVVDRVATILPSRWSEERVRDVVDHLYALHSHSTSELAELAKLGGRIPLSTRRRYRMDETMFFGSHPELCVRKVSGLRVDLLLSGFERISWIEPNTYRLTDDDRIMEIAHRGRRRSTTRIVSGPPNWDRVWDSDSSQRKTQFTTAVRDEDL